MGKARIEDVKALVRIHIRLRKFKEIEAPLLIISATQALLNRRIQDLTKQGFDAKAFLESDKGKIFALEIETHDTYTDKFNDRCDTCEHRGIITPCTVHAECPVICKEYLDSGMGIGERIQEALQKCEGCPHYKLIYPDLGIFDCSLNRDAIFCKGPVSVIGGS